MKLPTQVTTFAELESLGLATIEVMPEYDSSLADMLGDMFDPDVNTDIDPKQLETEKQHYMDKLNNDGVFGVVLKFTDGVYMKHLDSLWGIDDYDYANVEIRAELEQTAIDYFNKLQRCECCNQIKWPD